MEILSYISRNTIYISITILMIFLGLFLIYFFTRKNSKNIFYHFDHFFIVLIYGTIFSRILWFLLNISNYSKLEWSLWPYIKSTNFITDVSTYTWFQSLPWKILDLSDMGFYFTGILFVLIVYSIIKGSRDFIKIYFSIILVGLGLLPILIWYIVYLELEYQYFSNFGMSSINTPLIVQLSIVIVSLITFNWLVLKKRAVEIANIQNTRSEKNDIVKEIAAWTRLKNFGNIRKNPPKSVNNPSIKQAPSQK